MDKNKYKHVIGWNIILLVAIPLFAIFYPIEGKCDQEVKVVVKTIYASKNKNSIDPKIKDLVKEFNSVVKYSSYELLDQKTLTLTKGQKGIVKIPGGRTIGITSKGINSGRVSLEIEYFKRNNEKLKTNSALPNNRGLTLAGPEYKGGILFFNIFTSF